MASWIVKGAHGSFDSSATWNPDRRLSVLATLPHHWDEFNADAVVSARAHLVRLGGISFLLREFMISRMDLRTRNKGLVTKSTGQDNGSALSGYILWFVRRLPHFFSSNAKCPPVSVS
jgi:hypothetical protein